MSGSSGQEILQLPGKTLDGTEHVEVATSPGSSKFKTTTAAIGNLGTAAGKVTLSDTNAHTITNIGSIVVAAGGTVSGTNGVSGTIAGFGGGSPTVAAHSLFGNFGTAAAAGTNVAVGAGLTLTSGGSLEATGGGGGSYTAGLGIAITSSTINNTGTIIQPASTGTSSLGITLQTGGITNAGAGGGAYSAGVNIYSGNVTLTSTLGSGSAHGLYMAAGNAYSGTVMGHGAYVDMSGGGLLGLSASGGGIHMQAGYAIADSHGPGGHVLVGAGNGAGTSSGGYTALRAGNAGTAGTNGNVILTPGTGGTVGGFISIPNNLGTVDPHTIGLLFRTSLGIDISQG